MNDDQSIRLEKRADKGSRTIIPLGGEIQGNALHQAEMSLRSSIKEMAALEAKKRKTWDDLRQQQQQELDREKSTHDRAAGAVSSVLAGRKKGVAAKVFEIKALAGEMDTLLRKYKISVLSYPVPPEDVAVELPDPNNLARIQANLDDRSQELESIRQTLSGLKMRLKDIKVMTSDSGCSISGGIGLVAIILWIFVWINSSFSEGFVVAFWCFLLANLTMLAIGIWMPRSDINKIANDARALLSGVSRTESVANALAGLLHADAQKKAEDAYANTRSELLALHEQQNKNTTSSGETETNEFKGRLSQTVSKIQRSFVEVEDDCRTHPSWEELGMQDWDRPSWDKWKPESGASAGGITALGTISLDFLEIEKSGTKLDTSELRRLGKPRLPLPCPFQEGRNLIVHSSLDKRETANTTLTGMCARLLATSIPGRTRFTFIDPRFLGRSVSPFLRLGEDEPLLISGKVFCDGKSIETRLGELTSHIEAVTRHRLRDTYTDIHAYNHDNPSIAEACHYVIAYDFPSGFSQETCGQLLKVIRNGPRCGVYVALHMEGEPSFPYNTTKEEFTADAITIQIGAEGVSWNHPVLTRWKPCLFGAMPAGLCARIVEGVGKQASAGIAAEVPFSEMWPDLPDDGTCAWDGSSTAKGIEVPLGPAGGQHFQQFRLGMGLEHHAIIVGRPGSGKSNLMHVIITGMCLKYSPAELELYLVDFKGGVEFKPYATYGLPHARAIAIESEREFGLSVLRHLEEVMGQRERDFRAANVNDLSSFRAAGNLMPRTVLLVDEFQDFFSKDDNLANEAKEIFDRLIRKGRSAGIHVILGSQSISGHNSLFGSTTSLVTVRIALQCSDADSRMIFGDNNPAAKMLTRPGEAIFNGQGGILEANRLFQVARYRDEDHAPLLSGMREQADPLMRDNPRETVVFEGNEQPAVESCQPLLNAMAHSSDGDQGAAALQIWLGCPIEIRPPLAASLRKQAGSNLLVICRDEHDGMGICIAAQLALIAQSKRQRSLIFSFDYSTAESPWSGLTADIRALVPAGSFQSPGRRDLEETFAEIAAEVDERARGDDTRGAARMVVLFQGMHRIRDLREGAGFYDIPEDGSVAGNLMKILRNGPEVGIHVIAWCDSLASAQKVLNEKMMREFGLRVAGQMSGDDSYNFVEDSKASSLDKPHRLVFYDEEKPGHLPVFRPFSLPDRETLPVLFKHHS